MEGALVRKGVLSPHEKPSTDNSRVMVLGVPEAKVTLEGIGGRSARDIERCQLHTFRGMGMGG